MNNNGRGVIKALKAISFSAPNVCKGELDMFHEALHSFEELHSGLRSSKEVRDYFLQMNELLEEAILVAPDDQEFMQFVSREGVLTDLLRLFINRTGLIYTACSDEVFNRFLQAADSLNGSLKMDIISELSAVCSRESREEIGLLMLKSLDHLSPQAICMAVENGVLHFDLDLSRRLRALCLNQREIRPTGVSPSLSDPLYVSVKLYLFRFLDNDQVFSDLVPENLITLLKHPECFDFSGFRAEWWPVLLFRRFVSHAAKHRDNRELLIQRLKDHRSLCCVHVTRKLDEIIQNLNET